MAKGRDRGTTLSVLRTEDVPIQEVSGVCPRRAAGGDMVVVALDTKRAEENLVLLEPPIAEANGS